MKKLLLKAFLVIAIIGIGSLKSSAQGVYLMCSTATTTDSTGTLFDTGGQNGDYQVNESCTLLIQPSCAVSITLSFQSFATESGFDFFRVYDGTTVNDPELLEADGTTIPPNITASSGSMLIVWFSDFTIINSGFECSWTSVIAPSIAPSAAFSMNNNNAPLNSAVLFSNQSVGGTTGWLWYFGDGDTARSENPSHAYTASGTYTVTFIAFQCSESDTISQSITIQDAPEIDVSPLTGFTANVPCGDSATFDLDIGNIGTGQLVFSTTGVAIGSIKVLAMTYGTNQFVEFPRTIAAINQFFTNYTLTTTGTIDPGTLNGLLVGKNVLLIPEQQSGTGTTWSNLGPVIRQFVSNGGSVVFCGSSSSFAENLFLTGIFTGTYANDETGFSLTVSTLTDPITTGLTNSNFIAPSATYSMNITNPDKVTLVHYQGNDLVTYRYFGSGKAIYIGFDYNASNSETQRIIANAIEWGGINALPPWIHLNPTTDTVNAAATTQVDVSFIAAGIPAGTYYANIGVTSNDPVTPVVIVPCTLTVTGDPIIGLSDDCLDLGMIMQHTSITDTIIVENIGCDTLKLNSITNASNAFSISPTVSYLLPGGYANVFITFTPPTVGTFNDTVTIINNATDTSFCISGESFPAPVISPSVQTLTHEIRACNAAGTTSFDITNTGGSDLIFNLGNLPAWVTAAPDGDTLAPNASVTINIDYSSGTFSFGPQQANFNIISNDPLTPNAIVPFVMQVDSNPCVDFTDSSNTCTGESEFSITTINSPTTFLWDFGDGDTSTQATPTHFYASNGTYNVTLIACNFDGCDTLTKSLNAVITGPKAINCYPVTLVFCCAIGITNFTVTDPLGFVFNNTTFDAIESYQDYTCTDFANMITNYPYNINVTTGSQYVETFKMWLDMNNDGVLDPLTEELFGDSAVLITHAGTFIIPSLPTNVYNEPLRLRIASDYSGNPTPTPCLDLQFGQVEDYSVILSFFDDVDEIKSATNFNVYPNPFTQSTSIEYNLKNASTVSVEVFNILGDKIHSYTANESQQAGKHSYLFNNHSSGVYFVKLTVDNRSSVLKIMKM